MNCVRGNPQDTSFSLMLISFLPWCATPNQAIGIPLKPSRHLGAHGLSTRTVVAMVCPKNKKHWCIPSNPRVLPSFSLSELAIFCPSRIPLPPADRGNCRFKGFGSSAYPASLGWELVPPNGWFRTENPIWKWMMTGRTPIYGNPRRMF